MKLHKLKQCGTGINTKKLTTRTRENTERSPKLSSFLIYNKVIL